MSSMSILKARAAGAVNAAVTTSQIFPDAQVAANPTVIAIPGSGVLEGKKFLARASGKATTVGATTTGLATIYGALAVPANPFTPGNWTALCSGTARVINTTTCPWYIEAALVFDLTSGKLQGKFQAMTNNLVDADAALGNVLGNIVAAEPLLYLAVGFTFGVNAAAGNVATLMDFVVDA